MNENTQVAPAPVGPLGEPTVTTLPARSMLAVDGSGGPDTEHFLWAIDALATARERLGGEDVPLEGTYGQQDGEFDLTRPDGWRWTLAKPVPDGAEAGADTGDPRIRIDAQPATRIISVVHGGPYENEAPTLAALCEAASALGFAVTSPHTERYLTDPRTTAPDDLRTLLWYPIDS